MAPRIEAASIDEHVRQQEARILDASMALFRQHGYHGVDMEAIATAVGLARNSLYRYYPNKDHILVACVHRFMQPHLALVRLLEEQVEEPLARIDAWLDLQLDMATSPVHAPMMLIAEIRSAAPELRREIMALHKLPNDVLERALREYLKRQRRDRRLLLAMISSMTEAAAAQALARGGAAAIKRELRQAVRRLLGS